MDERCNGRSNIFGNLNLNCFSVATWNIRSLKPKIEDVSDILERKAVDICSFQDTKMDNLDEVSKSTDLYATTGEKRICITEWDLRYGKNSKYTDTRK